MGEFFTVSWTRNEGKISHGNHFPTYLDLFGYHIHGRVNAAQIQTFSRMRLLDEKPADHLRPEDMLKVMELLIFALQLD